MKKLLLVAFVFCSLLASAQQESFEVFKWNEVEHPFNTEKEVYVDPDPDADEFGRIWYALDSKSEIKLQNHTDTTTIRVKKSTQHKTGYSYSPNNAFVNIDKNKAKWILVRGTKKMEPDYYLDFYLIKHDTLGTDTYFLSNVLGLNIPTERINGRIELIGDKPLIITEERYVWEGYSPSTFPKYSYQTLINTQKGTLFAIPSQSKGLLSFHEDGTFLKRLPDQKVLAYYHNRKNGLRTIYTDQKAYELNDKTEKEIVISSSKELFKSSYVIAISKSYNNLKMDIILTTKGFNVRDNSNNVTYLFAGKINGFDSLDLNSIENVNLQKDSTLVICYENPSLSSSYLFTYKNGVASFHKKYDWDKLKKYNGKKNFYVGKHHTYMYRFGQNTGYNTGFQIKDDTTITSIRYSTNNNTCHFDTTLIATDENYLWLASPYSKCVGRLSHDTYFVEGNVFYDSNQDGYKSSSEFGYPKVKLIAQPSGLQLTPDYDGNFAFKGEQGRSYKIEVMDSTRFSSIKKSDFYGTIGVKLKDEKPEVNTSFWLPRARCFTNRPSSFTLQNVGVVPVEKVVIRLVPDKMKLLQNSTLVDTATFTYQNLGVHQSASLAYDIEWPEAELTGQTATLKTITDLYVNGVVASRKIDSVQAIIRCSYDPNDKSVTPAGIGEKFYTLKTSTLQYQIRFENTGNDTAYHVVIQDTLNSNLDFSTIEVLGASHKMNAEISKNGVIGFHFNYINLPDSTTDKKGAQGYVRFSVKPKTSVANNTLLCNKAAIYFDQNKPVITNSTCNLLVDKIPTNPLGLENSENVVENSIYPNPTNDWIFLPKEAEETTIYNTLGNQVLKSTETKLSMAGFEEGIYIAKVRAKNGKVSTHKISVLR